MNRKIRWVCYLMVLMLAGCNAPVRETESLPASEQEGEAASEIATDEPSPVPPTSTNTPEPTATATATTTFTPEPQPPYVKSNADESACYFGPGTQYSIEGSLSGETLVPVLGRDDFSQWVQIAHPTRERVYCWLPVEKVELEGDLQMAPYVPSPVPFVGYVSVSISPEQRSLSCGSYTFNVKFTISVTGPTTVQFRRHPPGNPAGSVESYKFTEAGTQTFTDSFTRGSSGTYVYRVEVSSPNTHVGEGSAELKCK